MANAINRTIRNIPHLNSFLADFPTAIAGWGRKPSGRRAVRLAAMMNRPFVLLEDGFIRSIARAEPPLSLLVDDLGVYYDARAASRMEAVIAAGANPAQAARAQRLIAAWRAARLSKYNHAPDHGQPVRSPYVLVVDQCQNDLSIAGGLADESSFAAMLTAALAENPDSRVLIKIHPDVLANLRESYFPRAVLDQPRITVVGEDCHAAGLIAGAQAVYTVTSLMGFEALLWGRPVRCFGMPFYAGWGLTGDALPAPARRGPARRDPALPGPIRTEDLAHAAFVAQARYVDPQTGDVWQAEQTIAHAAARRAELFAAEVARSVPAGQADASGRVERAAVGR